MISTKSELIYNYIIEKTKLNGYSPSIREICKALDIKSTSTVHNYLVRLEEEGLIIRNPYSKRAIKIVDESVLDDSITTIPIIGDVSAGLPLLAEENVRDHFPIDVKNLGPGNNFMLKIYGDSMINANILNGDYVIVNDTVSYNEGDIVVALIDDSATCKRFYKDKNGYKLMPENDDYEPIYAEKINICGKVVGVFRML